MRSFAAALGFAFVLSAPLLAQAGEGCPYSKQKTTTASATATGGTEAGNCSAGCPHAAAAAAKSGGGCSAACGEATSASAPGKALQSTEPVRSAEQTVATND